MVRREVIIPCRIYFANTDFLYCSLLAFRIEQESHEQSSIHLDSIPTRDSKTLAWVRCFSCAWTHIETRGLGNNTFGFQEILTETLFVDQEILTAEACSCEVVVAPSGVYDRLCDLLSLSLIFLLLRLAMKSPYHYR